jgi:hypothetical protein
VLLCFRASAEAHKAWRVPLGTVVPKRQGWAAWQVSKREVQSEALYSGEHFAFPAAVAPQQQQQQQQRCDRQLILRDHAGKAAGGSSGSALCFSLWQAHAQHVLAGTLGGCAQLVVLPLCLKQASLGFRAGLLACRTHGAA